jgi:hypothetical protein
MAAYVFMDPLGSFAALSVPEFEAGRALHNPEKWNHFSKLSKGEIK